MRPKSSEIVVSVALLCVTQVVPAQQSIGGVSSVQGGVAADQSIRISDVFVGRDVAGPYMLSWKNIEGGSWIVSRGGMRLSADSDYSLSPTTGALIFVRPVKATEIVRVDYRIRPDRSAKNDGALSVPLQFKILNTGANSLTLDTVYRPTTYVAGKSAGQVGSTSGLAMAGLNGKTSFSGSSSLTSKLYLDLRGGNFATRSALSLVQQNELSAGQFNFGVSRVGREFVGAKDTGLEAGKQTLDASAALKPIYGITASASFRQIADLPANGKGDVVSVFTQKLAGRLGKGTSFLATRSETDALSGLDGSHFVRLQERFQVVSALDKRTNATLLVEKTETTAEKLNPMLTESSTLNVNTRPIDGLNIQTSVNKKNLPVGEEENIDLKLEALIGKRVKLNALLANKLGTNFALRNREATIEFNPVTGIIVSGTVSQLTQGEKEAIAQAIRTQFQLTNNLAIGGGFKLREQSEKGIVSQNTPDSYDLKLQMRIWNDLLRFTGAVADNPEDDRGGVLRVRRQSVGVASTIGRLSLSGDFAQESDYLSPRTNSVMNLSLGYKLGNATTFLTSYRGEQSAAQFLSNTDVYSMSFNHRVGTLFDFSLGGSMTNVFRNRVQFAPIDYRVETKLGIRF